MSFQHPAKLASEDRLSSSQSDFHTPSDEVPERLLRSQTDITGRDMHHERPSSLITARDHIIPHSRTSSAGTMHGPLSSLNFHAFKRPSSQAGPSGMSRTKMLHLAKKCKAEQRNSAETEGSPYPFQMDRTKGSGFTQSVSLPGFFSSYSPILYFGDVGSFDSILQPSPTPTTPSTTSPTGDVFTPPRSGSTTPTTVDPAQQTRKGKRAELTRALRKADTNRPIMERENPPRDSSDLLFAWLSPIEKKVVVKLHPKSPSLNLPANSPFVNRAKSALRKTIKASHISSNARKLRVREAKDACRWLNAAGFPQYVQIYEDGQFPINLTRIQVEKDHAFLEQADIDALIRRLNILNRCADKMDEIRSLQFEDSDEETHSRALSDKWHFRRRQRKWSRRSERRSVSSNQGTPHQETLFSSCEDLLQDSNGSSWDTASAQSPLMLVSELRKSLTGLDRAVKTYSFMLNDEQVPTIQVEGLSLATPDLESATLQKMSSYFSSLDSDEDEGEVEGETGQDDYPSGSMDNFATGILDALESNLLKLKDYTTRSLPDVFKESTVEYPEDVSCEVSPLSSASASTTSIADSVGMVDPSSTHHHVSQYPAYAQAHPLAGHQTHDPTSPKSSHFGEAEGVSRGVQVERRLIPVLLDDEKKAGYPRMNGAGSGNHNRMFSGDSLGACSLAGSEYSERDFSGFSSSSPVPSTLTTTSTRVPRIPNGIGGGEYASTHNNGREHRTTSGGGETSPMEELTKRISKTSISSSSEPNKRPVSKWHGYQTPHSFRASFKPIRTLIPIEELSVGQISVLRKLCLIKITALIELHRAKANIAKLVKSKSKKAMETKSYSQGKKVFGVSLSANVRRMGKALPATIRHAIDFLSQESSLQTTGLFRRAASKAKVDLLKELMEENPEYSDFSDFSAYDVADTVKVYFRELPEPLLTSKFSEVLITLQESVPREEMRLPALQGIVLLLPDEHREALQVLLSFLRNVAHLCETNQMTPQNLAVCFAPTLFSLTTSFKPVTTNSLSRRGSFRRNNVHVTLTPEQVASNKEISESVASSHCLTEMICAADRLFKVAADMLQVCRFTHLEMGDPVPYYELGLDRRGSGSMNIYLDGCVQTVLREARKKFKNWTHAETVGDVDVSYLKLSDGVPLRVWKGAVDIDAPNTSVYLGLWADRSLWDHNVISPKLVTTIDEQTEVFQYSTPAVPPLGQRDHCLLRSWQFDVPSSSYVLVSTSVSHPQATLQGGIRATHLASFFLIEPIDNEHCRLNLFCRVDMRGRSAEYYNKCYGPYLASTVRRVRDELFNKGGMHETAV